METQRDYFDTLAAAFIRSRLTDKQIRVLHPHLFSKMLDELTDIERQELIQLGLAQELRIHRFKRTMELARVRKVLGILKGIQPHNLLDIGSGRGAFLWPLLDAFSGLPITATDILDYRLADIQAVHDGGIEHLSAIQADVTALPFANHSFDVVTMLEVLEHIPATSKTLAEVCRVARRFLLLSVPSKEDDNPEHIHLFDQHRLTYLLRDQGITRITTDYVPNHMIMVARIEPR